MLAFHHRLPSAVGRVSDQPQARINEKTGAYGPKPSRCSKDTRYLLQPVIEQYAQAEDRMRKEADKVLTERLDKLVTAIREFISRLPAPKSRDVGYENNA